MEIDVCGNDAGESGNEDRGREETDEEAARTRKFLKSAEREGKDLSKSCDWPKGQGCAATWRSLGADGFKSSGTCRKEDNDFLDRGGEKASGSSKGTSGEKVPHLLSEDEDDEADGVREEFEEFGNRKLKKMQDPSKPSKDEVDEHNKTHLPYRSWCRHCIRGRARNNAHEKGKDEVTTNEVHFDFFFLGREGEPGNTIAVLAVKERLSGMLMAASAPRKTTGKYISKRVMAFMKEIGCEFGDLVVKSDQEEALVPIISDVGKLRAANGGGKFIIENSPVGASQSNGVVERGIQSIAGQVRVLLDAAEARWKVIIPSNHPVMCYVVEYAAFLMNRFEVGQDGRTSFERCKGKQAKNLANLVKQSSGKGRFQVEHLGN